MTKPGPGKFEANESEEIAEALYSLCGESFFNEQYGDVEHGGWYALFTHVTPIGGHTRSYIVEEDNNGFFTYEEFIDEDEAIVAFNTMSDQYYSENATCDICGKPEDHTVGLIEYNWNGDTGNHLSCEASEGVNA